MAMLLLLAHPAPGRPEAAGVALGEVSEEMPFQRRRTQADRRICVGSPEQTCRMLCSVPACPSGQCAVRTGACCDLTCQLLAPAPAAEPSPPAADTSRPTAMESTAAYFLMIRPLFNHTFTKTRCILDALG